MKYFKIHIASLILLLLAGSFFPFHSSLAEEPLPKGVMLNLDFQNIDKGLIPNKTLYPLYIPLDNLEIEMVNNRNVLAIQAEQSLPIPHSSLLDPFGEVWIVTLRFFALSNGIIMSQSNPEKGYVLYLKNNDLYVAIRTGHTTLTLEGTPESGTTDCLNRWVTAELRIKRSSAMLSINRKRIDLIPLHYSFTGQDYKIRFGEHTEPPAPFKQIQPVALSGFTGAIGSIKMLRQ
jgi:hypothetical protein